MNPQMTRLADHVAQASCIPLSITTAFLEALLPAVFAGEIFSRESKQIQWMTVTTKVHDTLEKPHCLL